MIDFYSRLARRLYPYRSALWVLAAVALVVFVLTLALAKGDRDETYMLGAVTLLLWAVFLSVTIQAFAVPAPILSTDAGFFRRLKTRLIRAVRWLVAIVMTALCLGLGLMSVRVLTFLVRTGGD